MGVCVRERGGKGSQVRSITLLVLFLMLKMNNVFVLCQSLIVQMREIVD